MTANTPTEQRKEDSSKAQDSRNGLVVVKRTWKLDWATSNLYVLPDERLLTVTVVWSKGRVTFTTLLATGCTDETITV